MQVRICTRVWEGRGGGTCKGGKTCQGCAPWHLREGRGGGTSLALAREGVVPPCTCSGCILHLSRRVWGLGFTGTCSGCSLAISAAGACVGRNDDVGAVFAGCV